jgi:uracil phosphoribosyltransferase
MRVNYKGRSFILCKEIISNFHENHTKRVTTILLQNAKLLILQQVVRILTAGLCMVDDRGYNKVILDQACCRSK